MSRMTKRGFKDFCPYLSVLLVLLCCMQSCTAKDKSSGALTSAQTGIISSKVGGATLYQLQDKQTTMPSSLLARADQKLISRLMPKGKSDASINVFLLSENGRYVLFDSGVGKDNGGMLLTKLSTLKISPDSIKDIFITHFHFDHIGGMVSNGKAVFQNATVWLPKAEVEAWLSNPKLKSGNAAVRNLLEVYGAQIRQFDTTTKLPYDIKMIAAPGHTPGHTAYSVSKWLIVGDFIHIASVQFAHPELSTTYDFDYNQAAESRKQILLYAHEHKMILAGMHLLNFCKSE
jgi:glyoxylase-like metal-dependent hydrolase (beta-lactamase superfamily II)